ncbi:EamA family transporter [Pelosinus baikalensis]|uniref:EamA family transporter n=1 Tax=Pelosinus baikalensis TaxID=2892015 RepID=UPI002103CD83|nr:EamA family transporter [Pelosinus baikalensis]
MKKTNIVPDYSILANVLLVAVTVIWGISFVLTKNALASVGPFWFIGIRFSIAFVFWGIIYNKRLAKIQLQDLR